MPTFFVPDVESAQAEAEFAKHAQKAGRNAPPMSDRIYSITFDKDGGEWTATVGQTLRGVAPAKGQSRGQRQMLTGRVYHRRDPATVLAIFPGSQVPGAFGDRGVAGLPYMIVTDAMRGSGSAWVNPITLGKVRSVTHFRAPK